MTSWPLSGGKDGPSSSSTIEIKKTGRFVPATNQVESTPGMQSNEMFARLVHLANYFSANEQENRQ